MSAATAPRRSRCARRAPVLASAALLLLAGAGAAAPPALAQERAREPAASAPKERAPALPVRALTVKEAIVRAIAHNPDLDVARIEIAVAAAGIGAAEGEFDVFAFGSGGFAKNRDPFFQRAFPGTGITPTGFAPGLQTAQADLWNYGAGFRQRTPLGTAWEISYFSQRSTTESRFALDPQWSPGLRASLAQPLLRGLGLDINRAFVTIAREGREVARHTFRDRAEALALAVVEAYWAYVFAVENLKVAEQALETAKDLLEVNRKKLELGRVAPIEVLVAEAGVAAREEAVIVARNAILNARDALLRFVDPPGPPARWDVDLLPLDAPRNEDDPIDLARALALAFERRADLRALDSALAADVARLERARNDELARVDLVGSWTQLGLGDSHHNAHEALLGGRFYEASVGIEIEIPVFNWAAESAAEQAELRVRQDRKRRESLELGIALEVRTAVRDLGAARERIRAADKAAELAARQLEEQRKRLEVGLATNHDLLLFEEDLTVARTNALKARIDHEIARARLARATGTILERHDIRAE